MKLRDYAQSARTLSGFRTRPKVYSSAISVDNDERRRVVVQSGSGTRRANVLELESGHFTGFAGAGSMVGSASGVTGSSATSTAPQFVCDCCRAETNGPVGGMPCCQTRAPQSERSPLQSERARYRIDDVKSSVVGWFCPRGIAIRCLHRHANSHAASIAEGPSLQLLHIRLQI